MVSIGYCNKGVERVATEDRLERGLKKQRALTVAQLRRRRFALERQKSSD